MWNTLFRSFSGDEQAHGYFPTVARYGANMTPEDMYHGTRLAAAEALNAGMTTVHDWCHNIRSREFAERDLAALRARQEIVESACSFSQEDSLVCWIGLFWPDDRSRSNARAVCRSGAAFG